jgi:alpha-1,2-mannosyltransferase
MTPDMPSPEGRRKLSPILLGAAWAPIVFLTVKYLIYSVATPGIDFMIYHEGVQPFLHGQNPYLNQERLPAPMAYPIFGFLLCAPFGLLPEKIAEILWDITQVAFFAATAWVLLVYYRPRLRKTGESASEGVASNSTPRISDDDLSFYWPVLAPLFLAVFTPAYMDLHVGNIQPLNLFLVTLLGGALLRGRQTLAGGALAALCVLKILPVVLIPALLLSGRRRTVAVAAVCFGLYGLLLLVTGWWRWEVELMTHLMPRFSLIAWERGFATSLPSLAGKFLWPAILASADTFRLALRVVTLGLATAYLAALWGGRRRYRADWREGLTLGLLTLVLMSPVIQYHHFVWAFPAWVWLFTGFFQGRTGPLFFSLSGILWLGVLAGRVLQEHLLLPGLEPRDVALLALALLWMLHLARALGCFSKQPRPSEERL